MFSCAAFSTERNASNIIKSDIFNYSIRVSCLILNLLSIFNLNPLGFLIVIMLLKGQSREIFTFGFSSEDLTWATVL
jgi:hypothetical protein